MHVDGLLAYNLGCGQAEQAAALFQAQRPELQRVEILNEIMRLLDALLGLVVERGIECLANLRLN